MLKLKDKFKSFFRTNKEIIINDAKPTAYDIHENISDKNNEENNIQCTNIASNIVTPEIKKN